MTTTLRDALLLDVVMAMAAHFWFNRNEPKSLVVLLIELSFLTIPSTILMTPHLESTFQAFMLAFVVFVAALLGSISLYRLSFVHPLAKYPGPWQCKLSKLWGASIAWKGKPHVYYKKLHHEYGPIVRIGPNELSIIDADMIPNILGVSGMPKGPMWEGRRILPSKNFNQNNSLTSVRDLRRHAELRKPWNAAFKPSFIADHEGMLIARAEQFIAKLKELCSPKNAQQTIDIALWINYFTFDFMGDLAFGGVYSLMRDGDTEEVLLKMKRGIFLPSVSQHIPWLLGALRAMPFIGSDARAYGLFGVEQAKKRAALQDSIKRKDLFYYLLESDEAESKIPALPKIVSSALLAIVAGSDTTASVLANICYFLLREPEYMDSLRAELDKEFPPSDPNETIGIDSLAQLPFLNAVINETLRLQPPVPTSLQRAPALGSGGKSLGGSMYISEGTAVLVSPYVIHRCPRYFSPDPDRFWPGRWLSQDPSVVVDRAAFIPFSTGPANCPGRLHRHLFQVPATFLPFDGVLAMVELRYLTCLVIRTFDISFSRDYDPTLWEENLVDRFVMLKGELPVNLRIRKAES
ncbi:hypothetical protein GALMADRAFT_99754 [Galerina marginata CBS 339.88]|uniref:Cytochrome P450 n=1 Tax=Galerina marginata (strain CBS 339.88) TaxID=685588 RepID=A0A067T4T8_GALM3|nr:hypothetical protein GALMADRAFT_99754 [Galerina marginata CBS 339.88]